MKDIEQPFDGAFDVIVVGAGSAGCALAGRLAERGDLTVALLEAGGYDRNPWIHIPLGYGKLFENADLVWTHRTQPSPTLQGRSLYQPRGRLLGGTGSINGMTYMRGDAAVYDGWAAAGNPGWSYADVLPLFRAAEANVRGADATHGDAGPIGVSEARRHPIVDAFIAAGGAAGAPRREDFNGPVNEGVGYFQFTLRDGRRNSSVRYLRGSRPTLDLKTRFVARRILFDGRRAIGVEGAMERRSVRLRARREIVLSAGSFGSPHLLQLSGVGPGPLLQSLGLPVLRDNAAVGANYQDHFDAGLVAACREPITLNDDLKQLHRRVLMGLRYALCRSGPMATTGVLGGGFFRLDPASPMTDCQINLGLWSTQRDGTVQNAPLLDPFSAFRFTVVDLKPDARGAVTAASPDPDASPRIAIDFLATERDQAAFVRMIRFARGLMASPALARFYDHEVRPGPDVASDEDILVFGRRFGRANHHAVGTCRMGSGDDAVVDSRLKVHGVEGLRVADGSIMPSIPNGNTNAACVMIGEKAARLIAEDMAA